MGAPLTSLRQDWTTPADLFNGLDHRYGFTLDAAAERHNRLTTAYLGPDHTNDRRRDGLAASWGTYARGGVVWCNPPYSVGASGTWSWVRKAHAELLKGTESVLLVPARTDVAAFHEIVIRHGIQIEFLRGRLRFGDTGRSAPFASMLLHFTA